MKLVFTIILIAIGNGCLSQSKWVKAYYSCVLDLKQTLKGDSTLTLNGNASSRLPLNLPDNLSIRTYVGTFEVTVNNTQGKILLKDALSDRKIAADAFFDSTVIESSPFSVFLEPVIENNKAVYTYVVQPDNTEWLHLLYNRDPVLRYKLNTKAQLTMTK